MAKNDGGPAFPTPESHGDDYEGMSMRDYFAAHAPLQIDDARTWENEAELRYKYADAMLKERVK